MAETKEQRARYNKVTNKRNYERNKEMIELFPNLPRKCRNCGENKQFKDYYKSDLYNCKECFKFKNNERRKKRKQKSEEI